MTIENEGQSPVDAGAQPEVDASAQQVTQGSDEPTPQYTAEEFQRAKERRDSALARAQAAEAKLAEIEAREKARQFETMTLEQQHEELKKQLGEYQAKEAKDARKSREDAFLAKVVAHTQLSPGVVRGLLLAAHADRSFDIAPEDFGPDEVKAAAALMREIDPVPFQPKTGGGPAPAPGMSARSLERHELPASDEDALWLAAAKAGGSQNLR